MPPGEFALFGGRFQLEGPEVADAVLVLATPVNEGGFGNIQFSGDAGERPALSAQLDEPFDDLGIFSIHTQTSTSCGRLSGGVILCTPHSALRICSVFHFAPKYQ